MFHAIYFLVLGLLAVLLAPRKISFQKQLNAMVNANLSEGPKNNLNQKANYNDEFDEEIVQYKRPGNKTMNEGLLDDNQSFTDHSKTIDKLRNKSFTDHSKTIDKPRNKSKQDLQEGQNDEF